jgi:hypothetical protein
VIGMHPIAGCGTSRRLKKPRRAPDIRGVTLRGLGLVSLLAGLALMGALWAMQAGHNGPSSGPGRGVESKAAQVSATADFAQAALQLQAYYAANGTYTGATLPPSFGAILPRADAASYCLQAGAGAATQHVVGPGGTPASGSC